MRLRRQIIAASIIAGTIFTLMLGWMAYCTYPVPRPNPAAFFAFMGVVLLFWWLVGSVVAGVVQNEVRRTVAAIRTKLEGGMELRRRLEKQKTVLSQFSRDTLPIVIKLSDSAAQVAKQSGRFAQVAGSDSSLEQLAELADECSAGLARLIQHANQGSAQAQLLKHDLATLESQEPPLAVQLEQMTRLARQCNVLALNAAIENARTMDRTRGVGLLTEEIKQLSTQAEALAIGLQAQAGALRDSAQQSIRTAAPLEAQVKAVASEAENARALHDEQCEVMDSLKGAQETLHNGEHPKSLRTQMLSSAEALKSASAGLRNVLETTLKELQVAA